MAFINREKELEQLQSSLQPGGLFIIYGRRRVGKTELLKQLKLKPHQNYRKIYYLVKEQSTAKTLEDVNNKFIKELNDFSLIDNPINNIEKLFKYLLNKKIVFMLDEFPLFLKEKEILGHMQEFLDNKPKSIIILCGSYISAMEKIKDYSSPIYGRRMLSLKLQPLCFRYLKKFFPELKPEDLVKIYGCLGGIPEYLLKYKNNFKKFIKENFFQKSTYLHEEAELLLRYELRDLSLYNSILKSIAAGSTTLNEIAQKSYIKKNVIVKYIDVLSGLDIIKKELPFLSTKKEKLKERGALYFIRDNYFNFYYNFVYPFKEEIGLGYIKQVVDYFNANFNTYLGLIFEQIAKEFIMEKFKISFTRQWGNYKIKENDQLINQSYEIDLLAVNKQCKEIMAFEVKWKNLNDLETKNILSGLRDKVQYLPVDIETYKIKIGLIGKSVKNKDRIKKQGFIVFDLKDMA